MRKAPTLFTVGLLALAVPALAATVASTAQPQGQPQGSQTGPATEGRGMHRPETRAELEKMLDARFTALDTNRDGKISPEERQAMRQAHRDRMFARLDTDGNGAISRAEFDAAKGMGGPGRHGRFGYGRGPGPDGADRAGADRTGGPDRGKWAQVTETKADFMAHRLARFDRIDTNHDGVISADERAAARQRMRDRRGAPDMPPPAPGG